MKILFVRPKSFSTWNAPTSICSLFAASLNRFFFHFAFVDIFQFFCLLPFFFSRSLPFVHKRILEWIRWKITLSSGLHFAFVVLNHNTHAQYLLCAIWCAIRCRTQPPPCPFSHNQQIRLHNIFPFRSGSRVCQPIKSLQCAADFSCIRSVIILYCICKSKQAPGPKKKCSFRCCANECMNDWI